MYCHTAEMRGHRFLISASYLYPLKTVLIRIHSVDRESKKISRTFKFLAVASTLQKLHKRGNDVTPDSPVTTDFLPRCMECRRGLAMRILSVCPSVTRVYCDKTVERSVQIYIPYEITFSLVF